MSKKKSLILAIVTMLLWGSLYPVVKLGFAAYGVDTTADILLFAGIRFVVCGIAICIFAAIKDKSSFAPVKHSIVPILLAGLFSIILHYSFSYLGLEMTDSSKTALIKQIGSLLYVCFSFLFIKEDRPTLQKILAALVGFLGIVALNITQDGFYLSVGDLLVLASSLCTVISTVISKKVFAKVSPFTATGIFQFFGGEVLLIAGLLMGGQVNFAADASIFIMIYICAASTISYCIWYRVVKDGEISKLFIIKFAEPVFACVFGALILGENIFKIQYLVAFVLISGGIVLSNVKFKKLTRKKTP